MSIQAVAWALEQHIPVAGRKLVLVCMCNHADKSTGECYPSVALIAREASMSPRSVQRHIEDLRLDGIVEVAANFDRSGRQNANTYRIVFDEDEQDEMRERARTLRGQTSGGQTLQGEGVTLSPSPAVAGPVEKPGTAVAKAASPVTPEGDAGVAPEGDAHVTHKKEPSEEPSEKPDAGAREAADLFEELWTGWPMQHRPGSRDRAMLGFLRLDAEDRRMTVEHAATWRRMMLLRGRPQSMELYLRGRAARELDGAPPIDRDGEFTITPDRPEWKAWLAEIEAHHGSAGVESTRRLGVIVRDRRWPKGAEPARQIGMALT